MQCAPLSSCHAHTGAPIRPKQRAPVRHRVPGGGPHTKPNLENWPVVRK